MKIHLVRPVARLILLAFAATLISCANQPSTGGRRLASNTPSVVDPWHFQRHCFHHHHHCKKL